MPASLHSLLSLRSRQVDGLITYLESVERAIDWTPWEFQGGPLKASDAFVEPMIITQERLPQRTPEKPQDWERRRESRGELSAQEEESMAFYEQQANNERYKEQHWSQTLRPHRRLRLVIKGAPGGGKSCCTRYTVAQAARQSAEALRTAMALPDDSQLILPFWVTASDLFAAHGSTAEAVASAMLNQPGMSGKVTPELQRWLTEMVPTNRAFIVIDGLDELSQIDTALDGPKRFRQRMSELDQWSCALVVTCRTLQWEEDPDRRLLLHWQTRRVEVTLKPLGRIEQRRFAQVFFRTDPPAAERFRTRIKRSASLRHHCGTPLILTFCAKLHAEHRLPEDASPAQIYSLLLAEILRGTWRTGPKPGWSQDDIAMDFVHDFLAVVAWKLFESKPPGNLFSISEWLAAWAQAETLGLRCKIDSETLLTDLRNLGLIVKGGPDDLGRRRYSFGHRTFLEFLAAQGLCRDEAMLNWLLTAQKPLPENPFWFHPEWLGLLTFLAGVLDGGDATRLIHAVDIPPLIHGKPGPKDDMFGRMLGLKCRFVGAAPGTAVVIAEFVAKAVFDWRKAMPLNSDFNQKQWKEYIRSMAGHRRAEGIAEQNAVGMLPDVFENGGLDFEALGAIGTEVAVRLLVDRLKISSSADERCWIVNALGTIGSEAAVDSLVEQVRSEHNIGTDGFDELDATCNIYVALGAIGSETAVGALIEGLRLEFSGYRSRCAEALGAIGGNEAVTALVERVGIESDEIVCMFILQALEANNSELAMTLLVERLRIDQDVLVLTSVAETLLVLTSVAETLGALGGELAVEPLIELLRIDMNVYSRNAWSFVRGLALVRGLAMICTESVVEPLAEFLQIERDKNVLWTMAQHFSYLRSDEAKWPPVSAREFEREPGVRWFIAMAQGAMGNEATIEPLLEGLRITSDESHGHPWNENVRWSICEALGTIGSIEAVGPLVECLRIEQDVCVRWSIAEALGAIGSDVAVGPLVEHLEINKNEDVHVRLAIIRALGVIGSEEAVGPLAKHFGNVRGNVRFNVCCAIARALGAIGGDVALAALVKPFRIEVTTWAGGVPCCIAEALGVIGSEKAVAPLADRLGIERDEYVRSSIVEALWDIARKCRILIRPLNLK